MSKKARPVKTTVIEVNPLKGKRQGASLKEQVWFEDGEIVAYSLAYVNLKRCQVDHGRVLGMGKVEAIGFTNYKAHLQRFLSEVRELWRIEDEED